MLPHTGLASLVREKATRAPNLVSLPRPVQATRASPEAPGAQICPLVLMACSLRFSAQGLKQLLSPSPDSALGHRASALEGRGPRVSPRGQEPEAGLCLSKPPAQLAERRQWLGSGGRGSAQGHLLAVTLVVGGLQPGHGPTAGPSVQTYLHIYQ